jgi:hypothetical protein
MRQRKHQDRPTIARAAERAVGRRLTTGHTETAIRRAIVVLCFSSFLAEDLRLARLSGIQ